MELEEKTKQIKKYFFFVLGSLALILGLAGVVLPLLPTTPFLIITSICYLKSFEGLNNRLINSKLYKKHVSHMAENKGMTLSVKLAILIPVLALLITYAILIDSLIIRIIILILALAKTIAFCIIKTIRPPVKARKGQKPAGDP